MVDTYYVTAPDRSVKASFAWFLNFVIDSAYAWCLKGLSEIPIKGERASAVNTPAISNRKADLKDHLGGYSLNN